MTDPLSASQGIIPLPLRSGTAWINALADSPALRRAAQNPETLLNQVQLIKDSRSTRAGIGTLESGIRVFIKRHNNKGLRYTLRYLFREARPLKAFRAALALRECGVKIPMPMAAIVFRKARILGLSYQISEALEGGIPAEELRSRLANEPGAAEAFATEMSLLLAHIHAKGIAHGDFKFSNICSIKEGDKISYGLWDFDAATLHKGPLPLRLRRNDLARLCSSYVELGIRLGLPPENESAALELFLAPYERAANMRFPRDSMLAIMRHHLQRKRKCLPK
ncbi:MAG: hypothetical protein A2X49_16900 [Lentisphaerae bacterium GWF2_52_8]|nr:MAG: hypothetical protein A2X49_16900 [Lentisphaerae bacterium GWF2_52_8]